MRHLSLFASDLHLSEERPEQIACFEAFVGLADHAAYHEFNFAPSGQWAAYRFTAERQRDTSAEAAHAPVRPDIDVHLAPDSLRLIAWLPWHALPLPSPGVAWEIGLSAVIETTDGALSHWALGHPASRPDFHHRGGWLRQSELLHLLCCAQTP